MKVYQITIMTVLTLLLSFIPLITWANKKTAIIAGSAGGGAATVIGGTLWYKLSNYNAKLEFYFEGEPLEVNNDDPNGFVDKLETKGVNSVSAGELESKIFSDFYTIKKRKNIKVYIDEDDKNLNFQFIKDNYVIKEGFVRKKLSKAEKGVNKINKRGINQNLDDLELIDSDSDRTSLGHSVSEQNMGSEAELFDDTTNVSRLNAITAQVLEALGDTK